MHIFCHLAVCEQFRTKSRGCGYIRDGARPHSVHVVPLRDALQLNRVVGKIKKHFRVCLVVHLFDARLTMVPRNVFP